MHIHRCNALAVLLFSLPRNRLAVSFDILGTRSVREGSHAITVSLTSRDGRMRTQQRQDLVDGRAAILDTSAPVPGRYCVDLTIVAADGTSCAHETQPIEAVDGPLGCPLATGDNDTVRRYDVKNHSVPADDL